MPHQRPLLLSALGLSLVLFLLFQFKHLGYPLLWQDEAETAMFGRRVLAFGYPKMHGPEGVVYGLGTTIDVGRKEVHDAYIGSLWGQYYVAAFGVWLGGTVSDIHRQTALVRLPFALAGSVGLALFLLAWRRAFGGPLRQLAASSLYLFLSATSISLLLHLKEVRYYALAVLGVAVVCLLAEKRERIPPLRYVLAQAASLIMLFHVFYPASIVCCLWLAVEALLSRPPRRLLDLLPCAVAGIAALPAAVYFEIGSLARFFSERYAFGPAEYLDNLRLVAVYLLRYELLGFWLLLWVVDRLPVWGQQGGGRASLADPSNRIGRLVLIYVLVGARNPIFFERYFVALSAPITLGFLLGLFRLLDRGRALFHARRRPGPQRATLAVAGALLLAAVGLRSPEIVGRAVEIGLPFRGPLDHAIPYLAERYRDPRQLTLATNYEDVSYMFYLGCRVVGRFPEQADELLTPPDVIVPRRGMAGLEGFLTTGSYRETVLPVANLPYNNIPELYRGRFLTVTHLFRSSPGRPGNRLRLFELHPPALPLRR